MLGGKTVTKKKLMVRPNVPRFFREQDEIILTAKVNNLTEEVMNGVAELRLLDAFTMEPIASELGLSDAQQKFTADAGQSTVLSWELDIPNGIQAVVTQFVAPRRRLLRRRRKRCTSPQQPHAGYRNASVGHPRRRNQRIFF